MVLVEIGRMRQNNEQGTIGVLSIDNIPFCLTLEPPWKDNKPNISCVPAGYYACERIQSPQYGDTFEIQNVQDDRKHCIFHWGNTRKNTKGCVLLGSKIGKLSGDLAVLDSRDMYAKFLKATEGLDDFVLVYSIRSMP